MAHRNQPQQVDVEIGGRIRLRRMSIGMSQERLGELVGITFQQVQKYEKGTNRVSGSRLKQIADALAVTPGYFFDDHTPSGGNLTRLDLEVAREFQRLSPAAKASLRDLIRNMVAA